MSIAMLERAARELEPFLDDVAFVGGATVTLWITDPAAPEPRATKDVDLVVEVVWRERNFYRDILEADPASLRPRHPPPRVPPLYVTHLRAAGINDADLAEIAVIE